MMRNKNKTTPTEPDPAVAAAKVAEDSSGGAGTKTAAQAADSSSAEDGTAALQQALEASREQHVRLLADFDNYRKRVARERAETIRNASEEIIAELLPVLDHFELALRQAPDPDEAFVVGGRMVYDQLVTTLGKAGLAAINAQGEPFNPDEHDAIGYQPDDELEEGLVLIQTRCGYRLGDRVIRPATVIVSSGAPQPAEADDADPEECDDEDAL